MRKYDHVRVGPTTEYPWQTKLLRKNTSIMAWKTPLMSTFLSYIERILVIIFNRIRHYERYFKI